MTAPWGLSMGPLASYLVAIEHPTWLVGAVAGPALVLALLARWARDRRRRIGRLGDAATIGRIFPGATTVSPLLRMILLGSAAGCAAIAFAGPRWGVERTSIRTAGADIVVAVDASLSMLAADEPPNRLERAKQDVR